MPAVVSENEEPEASPNRPPAYTNTNLNRTTSSKLAKILGKEFNEAQIQQEVYQPKPAAPLSGQHKRSWNNSVSGSGSGSRESAEELGIDKKQTLKLQLLSMFLDDPEFRQSVQVRYLLLSIITVLKIHDSI